jgi:hypothetical protein
MNESFLRRSGLRLCAIAAMLSGGIAGAATEPDESVEAVWKAQQLEFVYRGYNTLYTCGALQDKLEKILTYLGAREDLELHGYECDDLSGIARFQVAMQSPVAATEENVRSVTTYDSKQQLIARTHGRQLPSAENVERFPAVWKTISFAQDRRLRLKRGDCELVEQLSRQILPRMSVTVVRDDIFCSPAFGNIRPPRLIVSALVAVPREDL